MPSTNPTFLSPTSKYNFLFESAPGKSMKVTDALSRVYSSDDKAEISTGDIAHYEYSVMSHLPISEARLKQFQQETAKDSTLQTLINCMINGWPSVQIFHQMLSAIIVSTTKLCSTMTCC